MQINLIMPASAMNYKMANKIFYPSRMAWHLESTGIAFRGMLLEPSHREFS